MKNFLFGIIATVVSTVTYAQDFDKILKDVEFQEYLKEVSKEQSYAKDYKKIKEYNAGGKIDETEFKNLHQALGYKNQEEFLSSLESSNKKLMSLEKKYSFSKFKQDQIVSLLDAGFTSLELPIGDPSSAVQGSNCGRKFKNCMLVALGTAIVAHVGCGAADVTVVLGLICHGAVLTMQYAMQDSCAVDYEECSGK